MKKIVTAWLVLLASLLTYVACNAQPPIPIGTGSAETPVQVYSVVATGTGHGVSSSSVTVSSIPGGVSAIFVICGYYNGSGSANANVSDDKGNTYSYAPVHGYVTDFVWENVAYVVSPTTASSMTFTCSRNYSSLIVLVCTGATSPAPAVDQDNGNTSKANTLATGNITPTHIQELVLAYAATGSGSSGSPSAIGGWTEVDVPFLAGNYQGICLYYKIEGNVKPTENVTFPNTGPIYNGCGITSFRN